MTRAADVICGWWLGVHVRAGDRVHHGDWRESPGMHGEVRTRCGIEADGYLTAAPADCPGCGGGAP